MFVSKAEALARLTSEDNLLREEAASRPAKVHDQVDALLDQLDPGEKNDALINDDTFPHTSTPAEGNKLTSEELEATGGRGDNPFHIPTLDKLDKLIHRSPGKRMKYRGNIESQAAIAESSLILGSRTAGKLFDLSQAQTDAYEHGMDGSNRYSEPGQPRKPELKKRIDKIKEQIALSGSLRLRRIVRNITTAKIESVESPRELAQLGRDVAAIIEKVQDKVIPDNPGAQFHIYRPEIHTEQHYTTVTVNQVVAPPE